MLVGVVCFGGTDGRIAKHLDGAPQFPTQIVQVRDVVIGVGNQDGHALLLAMLAGDAMEFEGTGEIIQADVTEGQVAEHGGQAFGVVMLEKFVVGALVELDCLGETILAVVDVADVDVETRQAALVALPLEDFAGSFTGGQSVVEAAQQQ